MEISTAGQRIGVAGIRQQTLLAILLLDVGKTIGVARLIDGIWGERAPATAHAQLRICVSRLRRRMNETGLPALISTENQGYRLTVANERIDVYHFARLLEVAHEVETHGKLSESVQLLRVALGLWRGPALEGLSSPLVRTAAARLDEERRGALEHCFSLELRLGQHHRIVPELMANAAEFPFRENLQFQLITALYRSGRQVDALNVYRKLKRRFREELGVDPSHFLRSLERKILAQSPDLNGGTPAQETRVPACSAVSGM
ncbi:MULTISPECIES: AfsR/SARP family transcriptional regulator [unclassified Streptomyces]|uniref:AfsR/SARP family transcriptional regulator n=1 Tax=unclassified Streptomyces TaxID=2593676 RepID=UPI00324F5947